MFRSKTLRQSARVWVVWGLLTLSAIPATAEERKFAVLLAVPRKSMPAGYPGTPLPNPNNIYDHYFDFSKPTVNSFAEYWDEISYGNVHVTGGVYGWVEVPWPVLPKANCTQNNILTVDFEGARGGESFDESRQQYPVNDQIVPGLLDGWWTPGERFADLNENGGYDQGEPFEDFLRIRVNGRWLRLEPPPIPPVTNPPTPRGENWATHYIRANYPGNVEALLARLGNGRYDGPDGWAEAGNTKLEHAGIEPGVSTPQPDWYEAWWEAYWNEMHLRAGVPEPPAAPDPPFWTSSVPRMEAFTPPSSVKLSNPAIPFEQSAGAYDPKDDKDKVIYPDAYGFYDGPAEYSDLPSSRYHARHPSGVGAGGDGRVGEVTSPANTATFGQDLGAGDPNNPLARDKLITAAGPMATGVHGMNGYDAGNVLNLEFITWLRTSDGSGGPGTLATSPTSILKRDYNLDGLLDQGSCRLPGNENYAQDSCPCSTNDGNPYSEEYPFNRRRLMEDVVEALDGSVDFDDLAMEFGSARYVFSTVLLPSGVCPPGAAPGGRGLFQLPAPGMDWAIATSDFAEGEQVWFSDFATGIDGIGDGGQTDVGGFAKALLCHEYLHVWEGYPDLYDYDVYSGGYINHPVGIWDIMAGGMVHPAPVLKQQGSQGFSLHAPWLEVADLTSILRPFEPTAVTLTDYAFNAAGSAYFFENQEFPGERFYFWRLTRVKPADLYSINFSRGLPGDGMMIMHTDLGSNPEGIPPQNRLGSHFTYNIVQADGLQQLENGENTGDEGDPWPGAAGVTVWNSSTDPDTRWWSGKPCGLSIENIQEAPDHSIVTFMWHPRLVPELQFIRPPGGRIVNGRFVLKYEAFDLHGGSRIEFYADGDDKGYDGVRLSPDVVKGIAGPIQQEFAVPLTALPASGQIRFYARLVPGKGLDGRDEPVASRPQPSPNNRGHGVIADAGGVSDQVTVDLSRSKLEGWVVTCVDDLVPGAELWEVRGTLSGVLPERATTGTVFASVEAGVSFRIDWAGLEGRGDVLDADGVAVLEDPAAAFVASTFKDFDSVRIVTGSRPGLYRVAAVLSPTRLQLEGDAGSGPVDYRVHSFKAADLFGPPDRFTFLTTGKTAYSRPIRIVQGKIVPEVYAAMQVTFKDESTNPAHRAPVTVVFDASQSRDELGNVNEGLEYTWDFGDGDTGTGRTIEHTYNWPFPDGVTVTLTVTNPAPFHDPAEPGPPPESLAGMATVVLKIPPLTDGLAVVIENDPVVVPEGGMAGLRLALNTEPLRDVHVTARIDSGDAAITVAVPETVTFTRANWNVWQTIWLAAAEDVDVANRQVTIRCGGPGLFDSFASAAEQDNDVLAIVTSVSSLIVPEGADRTLGVKLSHQPGGPTVVDVAVDAGNSHLGLGSASTLVFTPENWDLEQEVQIVAAEDLDAADRTGVLNLTSAGLADVAVALTEDDNDTQRILLEQATAHILEGGTAAIRVKLSAEPEQDLLVSVQKVSGDPDINIAPPAELTFTPQNWSEYQVATFAADEDPDAANGIAVYRFDSPGVVPSAASLIEQDNDVLGIAVLNSPVTVPEGGTAELRIALTAAPLAPVLVSVSRQGGDPHIIVQPPTVLTFTSADWNVPQAVMLAAQEDLDASNHSATIRCSNAGLPDVFATAIEQDNDVQAVVSDVARITVPEEGKATFQVRLAAIPDTDVTVTSMRVSGDPDLTVQSGSNLVFTPANWNVYQLLTIAAARDVDRAHGEAIIRCSAPGAVPCEITAVELDNTPVIVLIDRGSIMVPEGGAEIVHVRLNAEPDGDVAVTISRVDGDTDLSASPAVVTFTRQDWQTPRPVTVTAAEDVDGTNGVASFRFAAPSALYATLFASEQDNDTQQILVDMQEVTVPEGGQVNLRVRLAVQPDSDVTLACSLGNGDRDILLSPSGLTFTRGNWSAWQTLKLSAVEDADADHGTNVLTIRAPGLPDVSIAVREKDNDRQVILAASTLIVPENGTAGLTVALQARPTSELTVTAEVVSGDTDLAVVSGRSMVFTAANYQVARVVTVAAADDPDKIDGTAVLRLSSPGLDSVMVKLIERDNDPNVGPMAEATSVSVAHDSAQIVQLVAQDADLYPEPIVYRIVSGPTHGTIAGLDKFTGRLIYTPTLGYAGTDSFTFAVSDGGIESLPAVVVLSVQAAPVIPPVDEPDPPSGDPIPDDDDPDGGNTSPTPKDGDPPPATSDNPPVVLSPACGAGVVSMLPWMIAGLLGWRLGGRRFGQSRR